MKYKALNQFNNGYFREDAYPSRVTYKTESTVNIQFLVCFLVKPCPLFIHELNRAPLKEWKLNAKLHPVGMTAEHKVHVGVFRPYFRIPMAWVMTHKYFKR